MEFKTMLKHAAWALAAVSASISAASTMPADSPNNCDRACLKKIADLYFDAMSKHDPSMLPLSRDVRYTETGAVTKLGDGIWKKAGKPTFRLEMYDPDTGGIGIHAVVPDGDVLTVMALRLKVQKQQITEVEAILVPKKPFDPKNMAGGWSEPEKLVKPSLYFTRTLRPSERGSRYDLIAAADAYFRAFETEGTPEYVRAPLLPDTLRFENGLQTTNGHMGNFPPSTATEQFDRAAFKGMIIADRRYPVVDEETGVVMSMVRFGDPRLPPASRREGAPPATAAFVSEVFAVTQGKIVEIYAVFTGPKEQTLTPWPVGAVPARDH